MLVLSRRKNERIMIGDNIEIVISKVKGGSVVLGIDAPPGVPIHRKEVYESIKNAIQKDSASTKNESNS